VRLVAGQSTLDQISRSVRFITIKTVLPAIVVGGLAVLVGLYFLCRRLLRKPLTKWRRGRAR
jgi:predicted transporter